MKASLPAKRKRGRPRKIKAEELENDPEFHQNMVKVELKQESEEEASTTSSENDDEGALRRKSGDYQVLDIKLSLIHI